MSLNPLKFVVALKHGNEIIGWEKVTSEILYNLNSGNFKKLFILSLPPEMFEAFCF